MNEAIKYSKQGEKIGTVALNDSIFNVSATNNDALLYEVINMYLANQRQGTVSVKNRAAVRGSTIKMYRQKGTGNARAGSRRSPVRVGGGVTFGPRPKDWYRNIPKKKKRLALKVALTDKASSGNLFIIENLDWNKPNTKIAIELLSKMNPEKAKVLFVISDSNRNIIKSFDNVPEIQMDRADSLYAYEVLKAKRIVMTEGALQIVEEVFNK